MAEGAPFAVCSCVRSRILVKPGYGRCLPLPDLNLLVTLDVLLAEGSVARAARRLRLSPSAMSRALARQRETLGDPLLVGAGRGLVPTPRALELREQVSQLVQDAEAVLRPTETLDLHQLVRTFTLRTSEGFAENFGPALIARVGDAGSVDDHSWRWTGWWPARLRAGQERLDAYHLASTAFRAVAQRSADQALVPIQTVKRLVNWQWWWSLQQLAALLQLDLAVAVGQQPIAPNALES